MPMSGMPFVASSREPQHGPHVLKRRNKGEIIMNFERLARNLGFASVALAIIVGLCATIEYQPVIEVLAR
jgi:hypothetical protein